MAGVGSSGGNLIACMIPQLELFRKRPIQACITGRLLEKLKPLSALPAKPDVIEFTSPGRPLHYLDINNLTLRLVVHMRKKSSGENLQELDDKNCIVDCSLHSIFSQCEVFLSEKPVTRSSHLYNYKSVLELYSTAGEDARNGPLSTIPVDPEEAPASATTSGAFDRRAEAYKGSKRVELIGKLRSDVCSMQDGCYILDNVPLRVRLTLASQEFFLWSKAATPDVELIFDEAELWASYYLGNPELGMGLELALSEQNATYNYKSTQIKSFVHAANSENLEIPVAFSGRLPSTLILCMVKTADFNGSVKTNPYNFVHSDLQDLAFLCNGVERKYKMDMDAPMGCSTVLRSMYSELGFDLDGEGGGTAYTMKRMFNGRFACAIDLTIDHSGRSAAQNLEQYGTIGINGRFKKAPTQSLCILLYAQYESCLEINSAREVTCI